MNGSKVKVNYVVMYIDETEGKHCLSTSSYGDRGLSEDGQWLLLVEG